MNPERAPALPFDILNVYFGSIYDPTMHLCFRLDGLIEEERLRSAFMLALESDPYLSSCYVEKEGMAYWEKIPRNRLDSAFSFHNINEGDSAPPDVPPGSVDVYSGPCAAVAVYRMAGRGDVLTVSVHHGCCDARGLLDLSSYVFSIYCRLGEDGSYIPEFKGWYDRDAKKILNRFSAEEVEAEAGKEARITDRWVFPFEYRGRGTPRYVLREFPEERLVKTKEFGKKHEATVNDVLIAANILALMEVRDDPSDRNALRGVLTSADMRRHLPENPDYSVENLSIAYMVEISLEEGVGMEEAVPKVAAITRDKKSGAFGLFDVQLYESLYEQGLDSIRNFFKLIHSGYDTTSLKNPVFSNIGIIDERRYDPGQGKGREKLNVESALFLPVICRPLGFLLSASTWRGSLSIQCGYEEGPYSVETVERFLDCIDALLP
ncbi:MAG: condensation protein [Methanomicrobiaceae archaeon]|nr:condensation protein [Methanomicrobiaceae archaeon]